MIENTVYTAAMPTRIPRQHAHEQLTIMASDVPSFVHIISFHSRFTAEYPVSSLSSISG